MNKKINGVFLVIFCAFIFLCVFPCISIANDYTIADLRSAPEEFNESYEILLSIADVNNWRGDNAPLIGLTAEDVNMLLTNFGQNLKDVNH